MYDGEPHSAAPLTWIAASFVAAWCALAAHVGADARWLSALGAAIAHARSLPHEIAYAAVPSSGWHDSPALGQLLFHALDALLGDPGLVVLQVVAVAVALGALMLDLRRADARDAAAAVGLVAIVVAAPATFLVVRVQLFSLALFPVLLVLVRREAGFRTGRIWLAVPLLALWANLHGGVLVGYAMLTAYLVLHRARRAPVETAALLAASSAALVATPALLHTISYYRGVIGSEAAAQHYGLWSRLSLHDPFDVAFLVVALPLVALALRSRLPLWELVLLAAFSAMSVAAHRNGIWLLFLAFTPAVRAFGTSRRPVLAPRLALACCTVPLAIGLVGLSHGPNPDGASNALLIRAVHAANGSPILADPLDAERLAADGARIWIGNPLDAFPRADQRLYLDWIRGLPGGDALLRPPVRVVVVDRGGAAQRRLVEQGSFRELARDDRAVVYTARS